MVLFIRSGLLTGRRSQKGTLGFETIEEATRTFLNQFYTVSLIPDEIWLNTDFPDREPLEEFLTKQAKKQIHIRVRRSEKGMRLLGMAYENAKLIYLEAVNKTGVSASAELQKILDLKECPHSIEGIDVSNLQGTQPNVALVHFVDEKPLKSKYRSYHPRTVEGQDDFAMIHEVVLRRFSDKENPPPYLLMIDGGKGQLQAALKALDELKIEIPICSLAKARTESGFTRKEINRSEERIFVPNRKNPIILREGHPALRLLQQVRDEAHRFSVKGHHIRRKKASFVESELTALKGIGEKSRMKLLKAFGSVDAVKRASVDELIAAGLNRKQAESFFAQWEHEKTANSEE